MAEQRFQFRLRTLFLTTAVVAVLLGVTIQCSFWLGAALALLIGICLTSVGYRAAGIGLIVGAAVGFIWVNQRVYQPRGVSNPAADFTWATGLDWPDSAKLVAAGDTHRDRRAAIPFFLDRSERDGILHIIFDVDPEAVRAWLAAPPPFGTKWHEGPVPRTVGRFTIYTSSGRQGMPTTEASRLRESPSIRYAATGGSCGEVLAVDPESSRVWLCCWTF